MNIQALGTVVAPTALHQTRIELHWLAQVIGAMGDSFLERAPDDSQSNCVWANNHSLLVGRPIGGGVQLGIDIDKAELVVLNTENSSSKSVRSKTIKVRGKKLEELLSWAGESIGEVAGVTLNTSPKNRDYDMPAHDIANGKPFAFEHQEALKEMALWFSNATMWLGEVKELDARSSDVRCWPHHFDIGGIFMLEPDKPFEEARQMGYGWSPGDGSYDEPYFYITPFPVPEKLPSLEFGHWHKEGFTGAILTGTEVAKSSVQSNVVREFFKSTVMATLPLIAP